MDDKERQAAERAIARESAEIAAAHEAQVAGRVTIDERDLMILAAERAAQNARNALASDAYDKAIAYAAERGKRDGNNAASWYFDGNTTHDAYVRALSGIADGDPAVLDTFPFADLSGEWADTLTGPELVHDALWHVAPESPAPDQDDAIVAAFYSDNFTAICDAYELAFTDAVSAEIERAARVQVSE